MAGSGQCTADSLWALLLPEHNMVKAGHRSCLFSIKPIRKLHESRIFDGTVSEEENNPPSLFVLKSEAQPIRRETSSFQGTALPSTKDT